MKTRVRAKAAKTCSTGEEGSAGYQLIDKLSYIAHRMGAFHSVGSLEAPAISNNKEHSTVQQGRFIEADNSKVVNIYGR